MPDHDPNSTGGLAEHASERLRVSAQGLLTSDLSVSRISVRGEGGA